MSAPTRYDVIVVGAGPGGSMAAMTAASLGLRTVLVEEHVTVGRPTHCSGKLQLHAFREFGLPSHLILNTLRAGAFYAPDGTRVKVRRDVPDSHVVDRDVFDRWLAEEAQRRGAELLLGTRLRAAERTEGMMSVHGEQGVRTVTLSAPLIIDAEGARPMVPQTLGIHLSRTLVYGLQYQVANVDFEEEDCPEIYLGSTVAPGFFAWLMPLGASRGRVGLCIDPRIANRAPVYYIERVMREHPIAMRRLRRATVERKLAGPIPLLGARRPSVTDGMLLVGDAAGQVKATSGGGIYFAMIGGRLAAEAAAGYVGGDRAALAGYERAWWRRFGRELQFTSFARLTLNQLTDPELNALIASIGRDARLREAIERRGDTAFQSRLLGPLLWQAARQAIRTRRMASVLLKVLRAGIATLTGPRIPDNAEEIVVQEGNR